jgi:hypothetical protein
MAQQPKGKRPTIVAANQTTCFETALGIQDGDLDTKIENLASLKGFIDPISEIWQLCNAKCFSDMPLGQFKKTIGNADTVRQIISRL